MALGADRYGSRADTLVFLACVGLSLAAMSLPTTWRDPLARVLRQTVLAPFLALQQESELFRTSRARFQALVDQRDSTALAATFLPELRSENARLRALLGLGPKLGTGYVAAEVLHQAVPTSPLTLVVSAGRQQGVQPLQPVITPEGLLGITQTVDANTATVITWAHPEFRASAMASDGSIFGIVTQVGGAEGSGGALLELQGVPYREVVAEGTRIVTSGLGGVLPPGIPIGTVVGVTREAGGWERAYRVRPAVHPAAASHVLILGPVRPGADLRGAFAPPPPAGAGGGRVTP